MSYTQTIDETTEKIEDEKKLNKDRRNLFIFSLIIIVQYLGGVNLQDENITVLDNTITISSPEVIYALIVLIWFYLFLKYKHTLNNSRFIRSYLSTRLAQLIVSNAGFWAKKKFFETNTDYKFTKLQTVTAESLKTYFGIVNIFGKKFLINEEVENEELENDINQLNVVKLGFFRTLRVYFKTTLSYIFNKEAFLYMSLPYLLSFFAFIVVIIQTFEYSTPLLIDIINYLESILY